MFDRQEILKIVAERHGIIVSGDDPILSVLAVSDVIYDQQSIKFIEQVHAISQSNSKRMAQQILAMQRHIHENSEKQNQHNQRIFEGIFSAALKDWERQNSNAIKSLDTKINEFRKTKNLTVFTLIIMLFLVGFLAIIALTKGL